MNTPNADSLTDATLSALERTAMVLAEPAIDTQGLEAATRFARISYAGPGTGTLTLSANDAFLRDLAASLLGVEPDEVDVADHGIDALKEMTNILGGSVIVALSEDSCEYSLGLPETVSKADDSIVDDNSQASVECTVVAEDGLLSVQWTHDRVHDAA